MEQKTFAGFECGLKNFEVSFAWSPAYPWATKVSLAGNTWTLSTEWLVALVHGEEWTNPVHEIDISMTGNSYIELSWPRGEKSPVVYINIEKMLGFFRELRREWPERIITDDEIIAFMERPARG